MLSSVSSYVVANNSWQIDVVGTELWASCFAADDLMLMQTCPLACYSCGSTAQLSAARLYHRQYGAPCQALAPHTEPGPLWPDRGTSSQSSQQTSQNPASFTMIKDGAFAAHDVPTSMYAPTAEASTPKWGCPKLYT